MNKTLLLKMILSIFISTNVLAIDVGVKSGTGDLPSDPKVSGTPAEVCKVGSSKTIGGTVKFCNGAAWIDIFGETTGKTCDGEESGKYAIANDSLEYCNGSSWLTTGNRILSTCTNTQRGRFRFDLDPGEASTIKIMQFCNGTNWLDLSKKQASNCQKPSYAQYSPVCSSVGGWYPDYYELMCAGATGSQQYQPTPQKTCVLIVAPTNPIGSIQIGCQKPAIGGTLPPVCGVNGGWYADQYEAKCANVAVSATLKPGPGNTCVPIYN